jgi:hypothetical protein
MKPQLSYQSPASRGTAGFVYGLVISGREFVSLLGDWDTAAQSL